MRFVHTSDLHLGRRLAQMSLERDCEFVLDQLADVVRQEQADALVVAGDVYESSNPTEAAARSWDRFITHMAELGCPVLVVSGNHDSGARLSVASELIARAGIHIAGELDGPLDPVQVAGVNFWLVPFVRPADVRAWAAAQGLDDGAVINYDTALRTVLDYVRSRPQFAAAPNVCVAHQFVTNAGVSPTRSDSEHLSLGSLDNVDVRAFEGFDYVALGHLHGPQKVGRDEVRYAGSPLKLSSSEVAQRKSFAVVDITAGEGGTEVSVRLVPVVPLRDFRIERGAVEELVARGKSEDDERREDFVHAVVTDDDPVDVVARLRRVWPNLEQVTFDNAVTRAAGADAVSEEVDLSQDMSDLFAGFFEAQAGKPLDQEEAALVHAALDKVFNAKGGAQE